MGAQTEARRSSGEDDECKRVGRSNRFRSKRKHDPLVFSVNIFRLKGGDLTGFHLVDPPKNFSALEYHFFFSEQLPGVCRVLSYIVYECVDKFESKTHRLALHHGWSWRVIRPSG